MRQQRLLLYCCGNIWWICILYQFTKSMLSNKLFVLLEPHSSFRFQYQLLTMTAFFEMVVYLHIFTTAIWLHLCYDMLWTPQVHRKVFEDLISTRFSQFFQLVNKANNFSSPKAMHNMKHFGQEFLPCFRLLHTEFFFFQTFPRTLHPPPPYPPKKVELLPLRVSSCSQTCQLSYRWSSRFYKTLYGNVLIIESVWWHIQIELLYFQLASCAIYWNFF